jgi:hypothetical protein
MKNLIVAKYKEDVSWLKLIETDCVIYLYDKSRFVENKGRETETYFQFILNYYDLIKPDDLYIFTQGDPFVHCKDFIFQVGNVDGNFRFGDLRMVDDCQGKPNHYHFCGIELGIDKFLTNIEFPIPNEFNFLGGAIFSLKGSEILKYSKWFYEKIYSYILENEKAPWELERSFHLLFNFKN